MIGFALARRYVRRDITQDVRGRGAAALAIALLAIFVAAGLVPERYAAAREWAAAARAEVRPTTEVETAFADAGLKPIGTTYAVQRDVGAVLQTGAARVNVGGASVAQVWPRKAPMYPDLIHVQSFVTANTGGGTVEAPLVFVGRGISPFEHPSQPPSPPYGGKPPDLGALIQHYADDYSAVDVRGKVVLLVRFLGVQPRIAAGPNEHPLNGSAFGFSVDESIATAIKHGAAAVIFVDSDLTSYSDEVSDFQTRTGGLNPYLRLQTQLPPTTTSGVPVVVVDLVQPPLCLLRLVCASMSSSTSAGPIPSSTSTWVRSTNSRRRVTSASRHASRFRLRASELS